MNKKQLRQRIKDVAFGAGMNWMEDDCYWEGLCAESLRKLMEGLVSAFELPRDCYLVHFCRLNQYDSLDDLTDLFWGAKGDLI